MTGTEYYTQKVTTDYLTNFFNGLMANRKVGKHNSYPGKYFVEELKNRNVDVTIQEVYKTIESLRKSKMPTLVSGSQGFFLAKSPIDLLRYQKRLKGSIKSLSKEVDRVGSVLEIWKNAKG